VRLTGSVAAGWMAFVGMLYFAKPLAFFRVFTYRGSEGILAVGGTMLALAALWQLVDAICITLSETLRAAGDTTWPMATRILFAWGVFVPAAWFAVRTLGGGVVTLMLSVVAYITVLAGALAWRFASGRWREIQLVEPDATPSAG
jgi:MATE family multidrug resistance protein